MNHFLRTTVFVLAALPLRALAAPQPAPPMHMPPMRMPPMTMRESAVTVSGEGVVSKAPDEAKLFVRIISNDDSASTSSSKNNDIYNAFKARLNALHIGADALHTMSYNIVSVPYPPKGLPPEQRQPRYGFVTNRSLLITIVPADLAGKAVDAATASGVTELGGVTFDLQDRHAAYLSALGAAMADAKQQACALASAGGFHLGQPRTITTGSPSATAFPPPASDLMQMQRAQNFSATPTEIEPNLSIDVRAYVSVTYAIH